MPGKKKRERLFLLDGMALAYRAYFTFISHPLINSKGQNTSAIYGFVNALTKILDSEEPEHIAVVFDTREPTFRHVMYKQYKATREKMPEDMSSQMDKLKEVVEAFNVPLLQLPGYEADDIMGTLAKMAEQQGLETYLVTGDKDFMQLISPLVKMYRPGKGGDEWEIVGAEGVMAKFGVTPDKVIDVLGLTGDSSDNIPGVPGIGEKTAIPLIQQYGSIENVLKNVDKIPQKGLREKLTTHRDLALLSKKLVTIDTRTPIKVDVHSLQARTRNAERLRDLFAELEFRTLLKKYGNASPGSADAAEAPADEAASFVVPKLELADIGTDEHSYHLVTTETDFRKLVGRLRSARRFVFDTETTGKDPLRAELVGISFAIEPREAWYVPVAPPVPPAATSVDAGHGLFAVAGAGGKRARKTLPPPESEVKGESGDGLPVQLIRDLLSPLFSDATIKKAGQNIKYDSLVLSSIGIETNGIDVDTMVAHYVIRPDAKHNLDALASEYLSYRMISYDELTTPVDAGARGGRISSRDRLPLREVDVHRVADYSAQDADITSRLVEILSESLEKHKLLGLCKDVEFPLVGVLADMEATGVSLDVEFLAGLSGELERMLAGLTAEIHAMAGEPFNINSTQQLSKVLFDKLKLGVVRKTKTGFSTDVGVLEMLRHEHPIIEKLLDYRQHQKLKSTYSDALPALINPKTGRLHTSFNQTVAATGRLSSSDPNLQNIPIRTDMGRSIRKAFIPSNKHARILSADYSQIELRVMAHISDDAGLTEAFRNGEDIHSSTAASVFSVAIEDITREMRRKAKEVNFGIMYGIGPFGLATRLDITQSEAKDIIARYFERFPRVRQYITDTIAQAKRDGFVTSMLGRRRYLPDINSRNRNVQSNAERQAINMPIQGSAADMIKVAMIRIHRELKRRQLQSKMLLQVHDELVFEVPDGEEQPMRKIVEKEMKEALPLSVPVEVEVGTGRNWFEAH